MCKSKLLFGVFLIVVVFFRKKAFGFEISEALQLQSEGSKSLGECHELRSRMSRILDDVSRIMAMEAMCNCGGGWWLYSRSSLANANYLYFNLPHLPVLDRTVDSRKIQIKIETDPQFLGAFWKTTSSFFDAKNDKKCIVANTLYSALKALNEEG